MFAPGGGGGGRGGNGGRSGNGGNLGSGGNGGGHGGNPNTHAATASEATAAASADEGYGGPNQGGGRCVFVWFGFGVVVSCGGRRCCGSHAFAGHSVAVSTFLSRFPCFSHT